MTQDNKKAILNSIDKHITKIESDSFNDGAEMAISTINTVLREAKFMSATEALRRAAVAISHSKRRT